MSRSDRYAALFFLGLALYIAWQSVEIGVGTLSQPGPGLMSFGAGVGIGLLALLCLIQAFWGRVVSDPSPGGEKGGHTPTVVAISLCLFVYVIAVSWLGFIAATLVFVLLLFRIVETEPWWRSIMKAVLVTAGNYLLFVVWVGLKLPKGILPW